MLTTEDTLDDFQDRPRDIHQCYGYISNKVRCTNEAILNDYFCHVHRLENRPAPIYRFPEDGFWLPELTDRDSVLAALSKIAERLAQNALDAKRAGRLLYACQVANGILDGKLREQQLALKRELAEAKRAAKARVPHSSAARMSGVEPARPPNPTANSVILSGARCAESKDPDTPEPAKTAIPVSPQHLTPVPTNNGERTTHNPSNGPQNAPPQGEGVPILHPTTTPETTASEIVILSAAKNLRNCHSERSEESQHFSGPGTRIQSHPHQPATSHRQPATSSSHRRNLSPTKHTLRTIAVTAVTTSSCNPHYNKTK